LQAINTEVAVERNISESDWKHFRWLHPIALERFCKCVLAEVATLTADASKTAHARFLELSELLGQRDADVRDAFDDLRRSSAYVQIARVRLLNAVTDEEFARFSSDTQAVVAQLLEIWRS
jgi:hypothetical protein